MDRWRVWIETYPIDQATWSERVDGLLEALSRRRRIQGPVGWGAGSTLGSVFEVKSSDARGALNIGLDAFEHALAAVGESNTTIRRVEVAPESYEPGGLLGATDVARLLGVSRQRLYQLAERSGFPLPADRLARGALWRREDIEAFAAARPPMAKAGH